MPLHPDLAAIKKNLPRVARSLGFQARVTSALRSRAKQAWLYNRYLQGLQEYPVAPPGTSDHERGLALDVVSTDTPKLVDLLASVGLSWAGPADPVHFSMGGPQIASQKQKPSSLETVIDVMTNPGLGQIERFISNPVQAIGSNLGVAFEVLLGLF